MDVHGIGLKELPWGVRAEEFSLSITSIADSEELVSSRLANATHRGRWMREKNP
jgi:hypothetical protein